MASAVGERAVRHCGIFLERVRWIFVALALRSPLWAVVLLIKAQVGTDTTRFWAQREHVAVLGALATTRPAEALGILVVAPRFAYSARDRALTQHELRVGLALALLRPLRAVGLQVAADVGTRTARVRAQRLDE